MAKRIQTNFQIQMTTFDPSISGIRCLLNIQIYIYLLCLIAPFGLETTFRNLLFDGVGRKTQKKSRISEI